ncbi:MAG: peptidylprolyl isomerase [Lysobacteraceae bacterium]
MKNLFFPLLIALAAVLAAPAQAQLATQPVDRIVAVVDESVILHSELELAVANVLQQNAERIGQLPPRQVLERQVLEQMIVMRLQVDRARETGVRVSDAQLEQAIANVAQSNGLTSAQLRGRIEADGLSWEEFRESLREEMVVQQLHQRVVRSRVVVSEADIDRALQTGGEEAGRLYRLANILVALPDAPDSEQVSLARTKVDGIRRLIVDGEMDFSSAAIRYSDAGNALQGGDLQWRSLDEVPSLFAELIRGMSAGEVSEPVRGPNGFQIIHVAEIRDQANQTVTEFNARGIVVAKTEIVSSAQARRRIEEARARIAAGESFAEVAAEVSDDTSNRARGGDMGWFQAGAWGTGIANQLQQLQDGQVSQPFETEYGWHLVERLGVRETDVTAANRRAQAREQIGRRKSDEEIERFVRQLRSEAFVEIRLEG